MTAALTGFATGLSLILAIGAQNAFVLRQGLARDHVFWLCLLCASSDALLITAGILGFSSLIALWPSLPEVMSVGGAAFLFVYGALRLRAAWIGDYSMQIAGKSRSLLVTLSTALALTFLNPHVYLDTVGLVGAISTNYAAGTERALFGVGAALSSFFFFFSLGYGARLLAPMMQSARSWRVLDILIAATMWSIALHLLLS